MTEKKGTPTPPTKPDGVITTQRNGQTIVAELFFNHNATETFSDKLLKTILADSLRFSASDGQEPENCVFDDKNRPNGECIVGAAVIARFLFFPALDRQTRINANCRQAPV